MGMRMQCPVWLLAILAAVLSAGPVWARGGGGCIGAGTPILTPGGAVAIENLKTGDVVLGVSGARLDSARVETVTKLDVDRFLEIQAGGISLVLTPEHPVMVGPGEFRIAGDIRQGDRIYIRRGNDLREERVASVRSAPADRPAYNLLIHPGGTFLSNGIVVHNKGCFLPESPILKADGTEVPISSIVPGDEVMAFTSEGNPVTTTVQSILGIEVDRHAILTTDRGILRVTLEHPFFVGRGTFKTLDALHPGDTVLAWDGKGLTPQRILSIEIVPGRIQVYNLQVDPPHTFFAGGLAVHNKGGGGGGGCFPPGTPIRTREGQVPIEGLSAGNTLIGIDSEGKPVEVRVETVHATRARVLTLETDRGSLRTTADHPIKLSGGDFRQAGDLIPGARVDAWEDGKLVSLSVTGSSVDISEGPVYNLTVSRPHVFIASGFLVHNKGGGFSSGTGSGGGYAGGGGSSDPVGLIVMFVFLGFWIVIVVLVRRRAKGPKSENLDFVFSASQIAPKADKTGKLLLFLAGQDPSVAPAALHDLAAAVFSMLQKCWQEREYDQMKPLLMDSLFLQHVEQLRGMRRDHEINNIEDLKIEKVDLVNIRYTEKPNQREFTALISARARDYYVDDRTGKFLRGDKAPAKFQEFWTFQYQDGRWLLREVEQAGESDHLKEENFAEMLTDQGLQGIYGEKAGDEGKAGPWLEKGVEQKATRIERLLNFLVQTDKLWNRQAMIERARQVFLAVYLAREAGDPGKVPAEGLFPKVAESLRNQLSKLQKEGTTVEFRNLCVRKVELILIRNYRERAKDEYIVRISAHAQKKVKQWEQTALEQDYVTPFEEFWTFGRLDEQWKLKEVLPHAEGERRLSEENIDEDSSAGQLGWYYRQTRAN
jgi:predicted lipid-binding transport protein (Tim44 family)